MEESICPLKILQRAVNCKDMSESVIGTINSELPLLPEAFPTALSMAAVMTAAAFLYNTNQMCYLASKGQRSGVHVLD